MLNRESFDTDSFDEESISFDAAPDEGGGEAPPPISADGVSRRGLLIVNITRLL